MALMVAMALLVAMALMASSAAAAAALVGCRTGTLSRAWLMTSSASAEATAAVGWRVLSPVRPVPS